MRRSVGATAEVYFPVNQVGAPDWQSTEMVPRTMAYLEELPPQTRSLLHLLFLVVEFLAPFLLAGLGRFSSRSLAFRERAIARWDSSGFFLFALLAEGLKAQLTMMYMSHPSAQHYLGAWKTCDNPNDAMHLPVRTDVYSATTPNGLKEGVR